jgi:ribosome assembly protein YihI (activator of Der GTPase)
MEIKTVSRQYIIDMLLDKMNNGEKLTKTDKKLLEDMSNGK